MEKSKHSLFRQIFFGLSILLLLGNGVLGVLAYRRSEAALFNQIQSNAKNIAQCAAANVSGELLVGIAEGDEETEAYAAVIEELALFRDNAELEYIYTLCRTEEGRFLFVVDSDPEEPAAIGDECEYTDALEAAFSERVTMADDEPFTDEWGVHVSAYSPIVYEDTVVGAVGVDFSANRIEEQTAELRNLVLIICVITYGVSLVILWLIMSKFKRSVGKLNNKVKELASGSGDLTKEIDIYSQDELGMIAANMNAFIRQIRTLVSDVARSTEEILSTGEEVNSTVTDNARIMSEMNEEIGDISADMKESSASGQELSHNLEQSAERMIAFTQRVKEMQVIVRKANENAKSASVTAKKNRADALKVIEVLREKVETTGRDAQKIQQVKHIAEEIGNIAGQTRMLSLNAQIEAARAGSMGAGFTVVAEQVGSLSDEIDRAVAEINGINEQVLAALDAWSAASEEMIRFVSRDVVQAYDAFAGLGEDYGGTTDTIHAQMTEIGTQSEQMLQTISDISADVSNIANAVNKTAECANDLAFSTGKISASLAQLNATTQQNVQSSGELSEQVKKYNF